jgi:hypothetical protein
MPALVAAASWATSLLFLLGSAYAWGRQAATMVRTIFE